jgi:hypothetical protein
MRPAHDTRTDEPEVCNCKGTRRRGNHAVPSTAQIAMKLSLRIPLAIILLCVVAVCLTPFWRPIFGHVRHVFKGDSVLFAQYRVSVPPAYSPIHRDNAVYMEAGSKFSPGRSMFIMLGNPARVDYATFKRNMMGEGGSVRAENAITSALGEAQCFEGLNRFAHFEAHCRWERLPLVADYRGPEDHKQEFYEFVRSASSAD